MYRYSMCVNHDVVTVTQLAAGLFLKFLAICINSMHFGCVFILQSQKGTPLLTLMKDPYIIIAAGKKITATHLCHLQ